MSVLQDHGDPVGCGCTRISRLKRIANKRAGFRIEGSQAAAFPRMDPKRARAIFIDSLHMVLVAVSKLWISHRFSRPPVERVNPGTRFHPQSPRVVETNKPDIVHGVITV